MLPEKYKWLETIGTLPKIVSAALQYIGVKEIPGTKNNPVIMDMAKGLNIDDIYTNDDMAWCAVFVNHLLRISGKPIDQHPKDKYDFVRALKTAPLKYYEEIPLNEAKLGDIILLQRKGGGHVTILIAFAGNNIIGLGGNQSNSVTFSEFDASRIVGIRRFYKTGIPASAKRYEISSSGTLSTDES